MKISKEVKTGILIVLALGLLIWGMFYLKGVDIFGKNREYYAVYDHIGALAPSSPVTINGYKIGIVREVKVASELGDKFIVKFHIEEDNVVVTDSTEARVETDFLGTASVNFITSANFTAKLSSGDTIPGSVSKDLQEKVDAQIAPLKKKTEELISSIDSVVNIVQAVLNEDARDNLSASFESIKSAFANFESTSKKIDTLVAKQGGKISAIFSRVQSIVTNLDENEAMFNQVIANLKSVSDTLAAANIAQTVEQARIAMRDVSEIVDKINNGEGSMGKLVNDEKLYNDLDKAAANLQSLLKDIEENPQRYLHFSVFGRKVKNKHVDAKDVFTQKEIDEIRDMLKNVDN